jgi:Fe2+ or Zn2+ uptake regulation protein
MRSAMTRPATHAPAPPADLDDALRRIRDHGGRVTPGKRALAALLYSDRRSRTADEIATLLADHDRSAIYRNLGQFEELGIAEHVHLGHGQAVYRLAGLATVPVLCSTCGATFDLDRAHTRAFAQRVAKLTGVTLDLTHFPLTGTCARCTLGTTP